jgi:DNA repair protein RadA/Sms
MVETAFTEKPVRGRQSGGESRLIKLSEVKSESFQRLVSGESELDNVLGGGLVAGMAVLVAGEPGIGKSTLLTQMGLHFSGGTQNIKVLYVCGEESATQVGMRVERLTRQQKNRRNDNFLLFESVDLDEILSKTESENPGILIVDSIQTMTTTGLAGTAGSVGQVRECAQQLVLLAKRKGIPVIMVGHVTKDGNIAGPRVLEHIVDTVLWFEGERSQTLRLIRAVKNRFGPTDEVGVFEMNETGLVGISNPSQLLLAERVTGVPGSVVSVIQEGKRPMLVEIQALTVETTSPIPKRVSTGIDFARMQMLVAVLMSRAGLHLEGVDIYLNVTGGIRLADRGIDLAVCLAIASAFLKRTLAAEVAAVGEIGLMGEVRKVEGIDRRVKEAKKLGYRVASAESGKSVAAAIKKLLKD